MKNGKDMDTETKDKELKEVLSKNILLKIENNKLNEENTLLLEKETYYIKKIVDKNNEEAKQPKYSQE